ncbi:hypothetical protein J4401_06930 [Candidatus Woesearchaeota archaeon]|nr:hypothetical protein [Candidatus Woesearchaeota archaeon]
MALEEIRQDIVEERKEAVRGIYRAAKAITDTIEKETEKILEEEKRKLEEEFKARIARMKEIAEAEMLRASRQIALERKQELIESSLQQAKNILRENNAKYLPKLVEKAKKEINVDKVYCSKEDAKHIKGIAVKEANIDGGIIAENKEATMSIDYSYGTLLGAIKEKSLKEIAGEIFP